MRFWLPEPLPREAWLTFRAWLVVLLLAADGPAVAAVTGSVVGWGAIICRTTGVSAFGGRCSAACALLPAWSFEERAYERDLEDLAISKAICA